MGEAPRPALSILPAVSPAGINDMAMNMIRTADWLRRWNKLDMITRYHAVKWMQE
jgi:hypothetical protein